MATAEGESVMRIEKNFFLCNGFIQPGDLVFDIGVKVGKLTDVFLDAGARVICVEPFPNRVAFMREKYGDEITVLEAAVGAEPGWGVLHYSSRDKLHPTLEPETYTAQFGKQWLKVYDESMDVVLTTIDELITYHGMPAFIKLDVEASEYPALCGMTQPVRALSFEFGMAYAEEAHKCVQRLDSLGYEFNYTQAHKGAFDLEDWCSGDHFKFILPEQNEDGKWGWGNVYARLKDAGN